MKIRTDFVTNSSSSSFITIIATKKDGTVVTDQLESEGYPEEMIYFGSGIEKLVNAETPDGEAILRNIQKMYQSPRIDYLLEDAGEDHPLRSIKDLKDLLKVEIQEEIFGEFLDGEYCTNADGDEVYPESATVIAAYDIQNDSYSEMKYSAKSETGEELTVFHGDDGDDCDDDEVDEE